MSATPKHPISPDGTALIRCTALFGDPAFIRSLLADAVSRLPICPSHSRRTYNSIRPGFLVAMRSGRENEAFSNDNGGKKLASN